MMHRDTAPAAAMLIGAPRAPSDDPEPAPEELLAQLIARAQELQDAERRLRGLLSANRVVVGDLALPAVLRHIVASACELARSRYGALGVIGPDGRLEEFVHYGIDDAAAARIDHLPERHGLLGALIDGPGSIRLHDVSGDPRSVGFPDGHPRMHSFLGVPIAVRGEVFGNLYLSERLDGEDFSAEDEELVLALAATAGVAIEHARLYAESRRRQDWLEASTEVTRHFLAASGAEPLQLIARKTREIADADVVTVVLPTADGHNLKVQVASGLGAQELTAFTYERANTLAGRAIESGKPMLICDITDEKDFSVHLTAMVPVGPVMAIPLAGERTRGALMIGRLHGRHRFSEADLEMATTFANHIALALELADARSDQQRIALLEDRDRIARDLHDHVIQRLFAAGLTVQSVGSVLRSEQHAARLDRVVTELDDTIRQIRTSIFALRGPLGPEIGTVRARSLEVVAEVSELIDFDPEVRFSGPIDAVVTDAMQDDLIAVIREALTNVAKHARAGRAEVDVEASATELTVVITDNGVGVGTTERRSGLANLQRRAQAHGGSLNVEALVKGSPEGPDHGTRLCWRVPLG